MIHIAARIALACTLFLAAPAALAQQADTSPLSLEHRTLVRCSAAFALAAHGQQNGSEAAQAYPDLAERGQEFFVRASARVMDEAGLDRVQIAALLSQEAQQLVSDGTLHQVMPSCLALLPV